MQLAVQLAVQLAGQRAVQLAMLQRAGQLAVHAHQRGDEVREDLRGVRVEALPEQRRQDDHNRAPLRRRPRRRRAGLLKETVYSQKV